MYIINRVPSNCTESRNHDITGHTPKNNCLNLSAHIFSPPIMTSKTHCLEFQEQQSAIATMATSIQTSSTMNGRNNVNSQLSNKQRCKGLYSNTPSCISSSVSEEFSSFDSDYECESDYDSTSFSTKATACSSIGSVPNVHCQRPCVSQQQPKNVSFGNVYIREHAVTVGAPADYSNCIACPIELDWEHSTECTILNVYEYEYYRRPRSSGVQHLRMSVEDRRRRISLIKGISESQVYTIESRRKYVHKLNRLGTKSRIPSEPGRNYPYEDNKMTDDAPRKTGGPMAPRLVDTYESECPITKRDDRFVSRLHRVESLPQLNGAPTTTCSRAA